MSTRHFQWHGRGKSQIAQLFGEWIGGEEAETEIMDYVSYKPGCGRRVYYMMIERRDGSKENFLKSRGMSMFIGSVESNRNL